MSLICIYFVQDDFRVEVYWTLSQFSYNIVSTKFVHFTISSYAAGAYFLSRLNVVQEETMWSLILYVVCMYVYVGMCMYVVIFAKLITVSTYIDVFPWDLDTMILG